MSLVFFGLSHKNAGLGAEMGKNDVFFFFFSGP